MHICTTGDLNHSKNWWREMTSPGTDVFVDGPAEMRKMVREFVRRGAETIKLFTSAGHGFPGPVPRNMRQALERTYAATPDPKWVVAVGDCAVDGGVFAGSYAVLGGVSDVVPVDLHIRGCPPSPTELLQGLLALLQHVGGKAGQP